VVAYANVGEALRPLATLPAALTPASRPPLFRLAGEGLSSSEAKEQGVRECDTALTPKAPHG